MFFFSIKGTYQSGYHSSTYFPVSSHYNHCYHYCYSRYILPVSSFACNFLSLLTCLFFSSRRRSPKRSETYYIDEITKTETALGKSVNPGEVRRVSSPPTNGRTNNIEMKAGMYSKSNLLLLAIFIWPSLLKCLNVFFLSNL